jgi:subtilase family serine protease
MPLYNRPTYPTRKPSSIRAAVLSLAIAAVMLTAAAPSHAAPGQTAGSNTPRFVAESEILGHEESSKVIEVSLWLQPRNRAEMDTLARDLYDSESPKYRQFLKSAEIAEKFAPSAGDLKTVTSFLQSKNLKIVRYGNHNFFVRASGTVSEVEAAFHVSLNLYQVRNQVIRANDVDPRIDGPAAQVVRHVSGLDSGEFTHPYAKRSTPTPSGKPGPTTGATESVVSEASSNFFTSTCFSNNKTEKISINGSFPIATYTGHDYAGGSALGCGYTPAEIRTAYNLNALYKEGFDGTGQTIVILDWCGSPTIRADANAFSARFGLPKLTTTNFQIIETPTPSTCAAPDPEINIDVEWAHAIAPGANIDLIVPPSASFSDIDEGEFYAITYDLGNSFSGSYGADEFFLSPALLDTINLINELGAISGISTNFATGDDGDFSFGGFDPVSVSSPADSPYATAVGGVSLALKPDNSIAWQTGWGTNETLADASFVFDPPLAFGLNFGSGGGASGYFNKPSYQKSLPGTARQLPDISWLGDPFTGGVIAITSPGFFPPIQYTVFGGTSLATPMFAALWAIANQEAGQPLGQAAPYLYTLPKGAITDVLPYYPLGNVTADIRESATASTFYHSWDIVGIPKGTPFYSAIWDIPDFQDTTYIISFGTDSSLTVTKGWDNVTGLGTPNAKVFADAFAPAPAAVKK